MLNNDEQTGEEWRASSCIHECVAVQVIPDGFFQKHSLGVRRLLSSHILGTVAASKPFLELVALKGGNKA